MEPAASVAPAPGARAGAGRGLPRERRRGERAKGPRRAGQDEETVEAAHRRDLAGGAYHTHPGGRLVSSCGRWGGRFSLPLNSGIRKPGSPGPSPPPPAPRGPGRAVHRAPGRRSCRARRRRRTASGAGARAPARRSPPPEAAPPAGRRSGRCRAGSGGRLAVAAAGTGTGPRGRGRSPGEDEFVKVNDAGERSGPADPPGQEAAATEGEQRRRADRPAAQRLREPVQEILLSVRLASSRARLLNRWKSPTRGAGSGPASSRHGESRRPNVAREDRRRSRPDRGRARTASAPAPSPGKGRQPASSAPRKKGRSAGRPQARRSPDP